MGIFPRIKKFDFAIERFYIVPSHLVGRLDLISLELYDNTDMYKALAAANNIRMPMGTRYGIRQTKHALEQELLDSGVSEENLEQVTENVLDNKRYNAFDWDGYSNLTVGYISEVYEGKILTVPTFESASNWLRKYRYIEG